MEIIKKFRKYIVATIIGLIMVLLVCWLKDFSFDMESHKIYRILCDATFFASVFLIGFGLMLSISNFGLFTALSYSMKKFFIVFTRNYDEKRKNMPSYYEYRAVKLEKDVSGAFLYIPGVIFLAVSIIFLMLYNG